MDQAKLSICIDICDPNLMTERELKSLGYQLKIIYSDNRKHTQPANLIINNYNYIKNCMIDSHTSWQFEKDTLDIENAIYLSGDAEETLNVLENKTYVIGGLVDKNRHKNHVYNYCKANNIKCYKLPIKEYMVLNSSTILTTNQVYKILLDYNVTKDWLTAFKQNIPHRKITKILE